MSFLGERNAIALGVSQHAVLGSGPLLTQLSPSLLLQFAGAQTMDPRITFTRSTTATYYDQSGVLSTAAIDAPRFDYDPATLAPLGLLIEEQRANLLTYSEVFSDAAWTKTNSSITANTIIAPDGALTGDKLVEDTATGSHSLVRSVSFVSGTAYSLTFYAKASERNRVNLQFPSTAFTSALNVNFDLLNGTIISTPAAATASIVNVGNGWYRCQASASATATITANVTVIRLIQSGTNTSYTGDGVSGIFIWGAQLEAGAFATSYIPTVASQVTRAADNASLTGTNFSSWFNATEGTLFAQYSAVASGIRTINALNDGTANESIRLRTNATNPLFTVTDGGVDQADIDAGTVASNIVYKFAGAYAADNFAASISGGAAVTDTSGTLPTVDRAMLGNSAASNYLNGHIRQIVYYPRRLSNAELQGITS